MFVSVSASFFNHKVYADEDKECARWTLSFLCCVVLLSLWLICKMEDAVVALFMQLVMVAIGLVANVWDRGCHCRPPLTAGHGCNWACG